MTRPLSYLSDAALDICVSAALAAARRLGCGYDAYGNWRGPQLPPVASEVLFEYRQRRASGRERRARNGRRRFTEQRRMVGQ